MTAARHPRERSDGGLEAHSVETAAGEVVLVASSLGLVRLLLPGKGREAARRRCRREFPDAVLTAVPRRLQRLASTLVRYFEGARVDPARIPVPLDDGVASPFAAAVRGALREVPRGRAVSYGELAALAGSPKAARAVGRVMASNPTPLVVPCHRVVGASGRLTGFSSPGGLLTKQALLDLEGWDPEGA